VIGILGIVVFYCGCLALFIGYGKALGGWREVLGGASACIIVMVILTYPIFYLFWLPLVVWRLSTYFGSPKELWERVFQGTAMSLDKLYPEYNPNQCQLFLRYFYIGLPFILCCIIGFAILVGLAPLWYFIFSPFGLGTTGVALHVSMHFPHSTEGDYVERIIMSWHIGGFLHVWLLALPFAILSIVHLCLVKVTWYGVLMAVCSLLHFVVDVFPATKAFCNRETSGLGTFM
jgi:hypothetical protein